MTTQRTISTIAKQVFLTQHKDIQMNLDGCIEGKDPIHLHDLRVANRRMRAAIREFGNLLPEDEYIKYKKDFRWIHKITGEVRDLDVTLAQIHKYMKDIPKGWRSHLDPVLELLNDKRAQSQQVLSVELGSERVQEILDGWEEFLGSDPFGWGPSSQERASEYGCRRIVKRYKKVRKKGLKLRKKSTAKKYHSYRITVKRLRYVMEFLKSEIDAEKYSLLRKGLKGVQDAFGAYQDSDVQRRRLLELANQLQQDEKQTETLLALGQLIGVLEKKIKKSKKRSLKKVRWLISDSTARSFQSCFQYPVE